MSTFFPNGLDTLTNPASTDAMNAVTVPHADQHANANDAIEALEARVGIFNSTVVSSLDYRVSASGSMDPGHRHSSLFTPEGILTVSVSASSVGIGTSANTNYLLNLTRTIPSSALNYLSTIYSQAIISSGLRNVFPISIIGEVKVDAFEGTVSGAAAIHAVASDVSGQTGVLSALYAYSYDLFKRGSESSVTSLVGTNGNISISSSGNISSIYGSYIRVAEAASSGDIASYVGYYSLFNQGGSKTAISLVRGFESAYNKSGAGSITSLQHFYVGNNTLGLGSTTITNLYGLYIEDQADATNNYAIYIAGTAGTPRNGITWQNDTNLYRSSANVLKSDGNIWLAGHMTIGATTPVTSYMARITSAYTGPSAKAGMLVENTFTSSVSATSERPYGMTFTVTQAGSAYYNSALGATGIEGAAVNASGSNEGIIGGVFYGRNSGAGTLARLVGILINTAENTGGGHITNVRQLDIASSGPHTANSQHRYMIRLADSASASGFSGGYSAGVSFNTSNKISANGFLWSTDTNLYSNALSGLRTDGELSAGRRVTTTVTVLTSAASVVVNAAHSNHFRLTLGGNVSLTRPVSAIDGQKITFEIAQDLTGGRTITYDQCYRFGTDLTSATLSTSGLKVDLLTCVFSAPMSAFLVAGFVKGF